VPTLILYRFRYLDPARNKWLLARYAAEFPMVEVDSSYYALPSERNSVLWVERTPPSSGS